MREVVINKNDANQRLDKFLTKYMKNLPQSMLYKGLRKNCVRVNGKHIKNGDFNLSEGDILALYFRDEFFSDPKPFNKAPSDIDAVYEDENILIVNKEAGLVVHADDRGSSDTLIDRVQSYLYEKGEYNPESEHSFAPSLSNRLDRNTEGLVIAAKNAESLRIINEKIKNREIEKLYLCIAEGDIKKSGEISAYLTKLDKSVSVSDTETEGSKHVKLTYKKIAYDGDCSLAEVNLLTGRTHQIRALFSHIGHPLRGDVKYGAKKAVRRYSLCSYKLTFGFKSDAGILNYLKDKSFCISPEFIESFSDTNV